MQVAAVVAAEAIAATAAAEVAAEAAVTAQAAVKVASEAAAKAAQKATEVAARAASAAAAAAAETAMLTARDVLADRAAAVASAAACLLGDGPGVPRPEVAAETAAADEAAADAAVAATALAAATVAVTVVAVAATAARAVVEAANLIEGQLGQDVADAADAVDRATATLVAQLDGNALEARSDGLSATATGQEQHGPAASLSPPGRTTRVPVPHQGAARSSLTWTVTICGTALTVLVVALLVGRGHAWASTVADVSFVVFPAFAAVSAWRAARSRVGRDQLAWRLLAAAWSTWGAAGAVFTVQGLQGAHPYPSLADALNLLFCVPAVAGLLLLPSLARDGWSRVRTLLDGAVVGVGLVFLSWHLVLGPVFHDDNVGLARGTSLAYPVVDLVSLAFVLTLALRATPDGRRVWLLLAGGFTSLALVDSVYALQALAGTYQSGTVTNALYAVAFSFFAIAPCLARAPERRLTRLTGWQEALPYLPLLGCVIVLAVSPSAEDRPLLVATFFLLVLVAGLRQILIIMENIRLADDLEDRVDLRTTELHAEREFLTAIVDNLHDGIMACDADGRLTFLNQATLDYVQRGLVTVPQQRLPATYGLRDPDTLELLTADDMPLLRALRGGAVVNQELVIRRADGSRIDVCASGRALRTSEGSVAGAVVALHNVTEQREARLALELRALTDDLTGLGNRLQFSEHLDAALLRSRRGEPDVAVLLLDLDDFKLVNDGLGHAAGDELLVEVARRIRTTLRAGDEAARIGGDEFVLLLEPTTAKDAMSVAGRLLAILEAPIVVGGTEVFMSASIGVALTDTHHQANSLMGAADLAMYLAKTRGKGGAELFEPEMQVAAVERLSLQGDLRQAVHEQQLHLVYQPIVDLHTGALIGVEALLRWDHERRGAVSPIDFIPVAEETGLILPLGEWALREAVAQRERWQRQFPDAQLLVSVNVSVRQLERGKLISVLDELLDLGLRSRDLVLEITETALALDDLATANSLQAICDRGIQLAVDDFGTGYSSLSRLQSAPVSRLKIDRAFVAKITDGRTDVPIVDATMAMADGLGLGVVAEGVETLAQLDYLRGLGCSQAQGYLLSRPLDAAGIANILAGMVPWDELVRR